MFSTLSHMIHWFIFISPINFINSHPLKLQDILTFLSNNCGWSGSSSMEDASVRESHDSSLRELLVNLVKQIFSQPQYCVVAEIVI